jgi:hypothetical protein
MEERVAERVVEQLTNGLESISEATGLIRETCSDAERRVHFEPISQAMALLFDELDLIFEEHPNLKPQGDQSS